MNIFDFIHRLVFSLLLFVLLLPHQSSLLAKIRIKESVILDKHKADLSVFFNASTPFVDPCKEIPNRYGYKDVPDARAIQVWSKEYARRRGDGYWFMQTPIHYFEELVPHKYHRNYYHWKVRYEGLTTGLRSNSSRTMRKAAKNRCLHDRIDGQNDPELLTRVLDNELSYFLGFYEFPKGNRTNCGKMLWPSTMLLDKAMKDLEFEMPIPFGIHFDLKAEQILSDKQIKSLLPKKLKDPRIMLDDEFIGAYRYLDRFIKYGEIPISNSGYMNLHDVTVHLGAILAHPFEIKAYQKTVETARQLVIDLPMNTSDEIQLQKKLLIALCDFIDYLTFTFASRLPDLINAAFQEVPIGVLNQKLQAVGPYLLVSDHVDDDILIKIGKKYQEIHLNNIMLKHASRCSQYPCAPVDLFDALFTYTSVYKQILLTKSEKNTLKNIIAAYKTDLSLNTPVPEFNWANGSNLERGKRTIDYIQSMDIALEAWKKKNGVQGELDPFAF